jgi:prolyl-tRNA synthetase
VHLVAAGKDLTRDPEVFTRAEELTRELEAAGISVLYDDRHKVSPGVKFKDSELIGIPTIVVVGKSLEHGVVEVKDRATGERTEVAVGDVVETVRRLVAGADAGATGVTG